MKFKRIISLGMISALIAGTINITANAEDTSENETKNYNDYVVGDMPESIMKWAASTETEANRPGERGWMETSRNCRAVDTDPNFDGNKLGINWGTGGSYSPRSIYTLAAITGDKATEEGPAYGYNTVGGDGMASIVYTAYKADRAVNYFKMDNSKNYVFRVYIKDNYPGVGEAPLVNFAVSNDNVAGRAWSKEYGAEGFRVTGEFEAYAGTFNLPDTFNNDGTQTISSGYMIGNGVGESIAYKTSNLGDVYFAEEVAYNIKNTKTSDETGLFTGDTATFEASIINQIGSEGYLDQNFVWKIENLHGEDVTEYMEITPVAGTAKVSIKPNTDLENGTYKAYALSTDYGMCRSIEFEAYAQKNAYNIYVDGALGNDENSGDENAPVKTIGKAIELVRTLKSESYSYQYIINIADGEYYFDKSQHLTAEDSGKPGAPTIIKAINPGKVTFTGAVKIDTSNAKRVTDKEILSKMYESVRDKVYEIDLLEGGFPYDLAGELNHASGAGSMLYSIEYPEIYLDGDEQMIAQWPNGEGQYSNVDITVDAVSFRSRYDDYSRWVNAKDFWIAGYYVTDYGYRRLYVDSVNTERNIITMEDTGVSSDYMGVVTNHSKRYKAMNLLEEIDVPGEWYIDRDTMKLYYYIPENIKDKTLEITALKHRMFILTETENFKFSGIKFTKSRDEIIYMTDVSGIEIADCVFEDVLAGAIFSTGSEDALTDKNYWQRQKIDGANNCLIENCIFENVGGVAVDITGGNVDTLEGSGNIIRNNIFHRIGQKTRYSNAVKLQGCGNVFEYNNISACPYQAIMSMGNDHIIRYNEIHDVCQETDDCGAIYQGRSALQRGVEIAYNYLHNLNSVEDLPVKHQNGIYWDDAQGGQWAHDNIIKDVNIDIYNAGVDNKFENNVSINVPKVLYFKNGGVPTHSEDKTITTFQGYIEYPEIYYGKYKNLQYILENFGDENLATLTEVKGNIALNSTEVALENLVTASGNVQTDNEDIFIGEDEHDFRISKATQKELGISNNLNEDFNMDLIGVQSDLTVSEEPLGLNYPLEDEILVDGTNAYFNWDYIDGATKYTLIVASDVKFEKKVYEKEVVYNHLTTTLADGKYYWKVVAKNTSREFPFVRESSVRTLTVGEVYKLTDFNVALDETNRKITGKLTYNGDVAEISEYVYTAIYDSGFILRITIRELAKHH